MKTGTRVLGIDDASFSFDDRTAFVVGVVYRGTEFIEDIRIDRVEVDGYDATEAVVRIHDAVNNPGQVRAVIVDGISFAGFNLIDIHRVAEETGKPVVAVTSNAPDRQDFRRTMERTGNVDEVFEKFDEARELELKDGRCYVQFAGTDFSGAEGIVKSSTIHGLTPEPVRVAHIIGQAMGSTLKNPAGDS